MKTFKVMNNLTAVNTNEFISVTNRVRLQVRSEGKCICYHSTDMDFSDEVLAGHGTGGEYEVLCPPGYVRFKSTGRVWVNNPARDQTIHAMTDEVFTTLDRPSPMSPEMMAIHRMMKQNEIEREAMRQQLGAVQHAVRNPDTGIREETSSQDTTAEEADLVEDTTGSEATVDEPTDQPAEKRPDADNVSE